MPEPVAPRTRRLDQAGAGPVVELAVGDAGGRAGGRAAVADVLVEAGRSSVNSRPCAGLGAAERAARAVASPVPLTPTLLVRAPSRRSPVAGALTRVDYTVALPFDGRRAGSQRQRRRRSSSTRRVTIAAAARRLRTLAVGSIASLVDAGRPVDSGCGLLRCGPAKSSGEIWSRNSRNFSTSSSCSSGIAIAGLVEHLLGAEDPASRCAAPARSRPTGRALTSTPPAKTSSA